MELPEPPEPDEPEVEVLPEPEPSLPLTPPMMDPAEPPPPEMEAPERRGPRWGLVLLLGAIVAAGFGIGYAWHRWSTPAPPISPGKPAALPRTAQAPLPEAPKAPEAPKPQEPPAPEKAVAAEKAPAAQPKAFGFSREERFAALLGGDLPTALSQGGGYSASLSPGDWSLRLEIACQGETVQKAAKLLEEAKPDLFLRPLRMRDGKTCYQVFFGRFASKNAAEQAIGALPAPFRVEGNKPKPFQIQEIPE